MAEGHPGATTPSWLLWTRLFQTFQVALDPKKLLLAAAGLLLMAFGSKLLSAAYFGMRSAPLATSYEEGSDELQRATERYQFITHLAGPGGSFREMPWHEHRGPNPYLMATGQAGETSGSRALARWLVGDGVPVLLEPAVKFLKPVTMLLHPRADFPTRLYLLGIAFWTLLVWAFFGGAITRIAAMQLAGKEPPGMGDALRFMVTRYVHYVAAPLVPLLFVAGIVVVTILFGFVHLIPYLGDLFDGILWPIPLLLGFAQALLLVGLTGYPLMFATISAEGSDTFDALSRSYNYVYQCPWHYIWYCLVAVVYGAVIVFFVGFMGSLVVYMTKWSLSQTPGTQYFTSRKVDHLFMYAPTTFGWRDLLVDQPELKSSDEEVRNTYRKANLMAGNYISAALVGLWTLLVLLLVVGYGYSYFFCASTMIYLLMRHKVDDTDLDEVYDEDEMPDEPLLPPSPGPAAEPTAPPVQMVEPPVLRVPAADTPAGSDKPS